VQKLIERVMDRRRVDHSLHVLGKIAQRSGVSLNSLAWGGVGTSKTFSVTETNE
jgi:hypothetical protein